MAEERAERRPAGAADQAAEIDTSVAHPARVYDYWLGGQKQLPGRPRGRRARARGHSRAAVPGQGEPRVPGRAVRYLAADAGIRQFLDIGTGIPAANNTHEVAQAVVPDARIVYLDNDRCKSVVHTVQIWSGCVHRTGSKAECPGQVLRAWRSGVYSKVIAGHGWKARRRLWRASLEDEMANEETRLNVPRLEGWETLTEAATRLA